MNCPRCQSPLGAVETDGEQIQQCAACKGEWLSSGELQRILQHHDEVFTADEIASIQGVNQEILTAEKDDHDELDCPNCTGVRMEHFNYGDTSGIILHRCLQCNGIWMDKDQLEKVEALVDGWKGCLNQDVAKYGPLLDKIEFQEEAEIDKEVSISKVGFVNAILRRFSE
jgi:Zn-finger nucleic acid-binding protein